MKKCVHCKEMIDEKATKCKFCQADLRNWFMRHKLLTLLLGIVVLIIVFINSIAAPTTVSPVTSAYEIVSEEASESQKTITVYTAEKNSQELIRINDNLVLENGRYLILFIRYFDDKEIAKSYFDKQASESTTEKESDELFTHYIADFKSTTNEFNINKIESWELIKQY